MGNLRWTVLKRGLGGPIWNNSSPPVQTFPEGIGTDRCLCVGHGGTAFGCSDLAADLDSSAMAGAVLKRLASLESNLLMLRDSILAADGGYYPSSQALQPGWWQAWAKLVGRQTRTEGRMEIARTKK